MTNLTELPAWQALINHHQALKENAFNKGLMQHPSRIQQFSLSVSGIQLDYSRNLITTDTLNLLSEVAKARQLNLKIQALFRGEPLNFTEKKAALHTHLRHPTPPALLINDSNITPAILKMRSRMIDFAAAIHDGRLRGVTGKRIQHIINIGMGGSHTGPLLTIQALKDFAISTLSFHFISTVDEAMVNEVWDQIDTETSLFIISSKSFNTIETLTNAKTLIKRMQNKWGEKAISHHFIAITAHPEKAQTLGINEKFIFPLWDWIGGRYSIWSAIGLPLLLMIGPKHFEDFLQGAHEMDQHFQEASFTKNMPVLLALISIWYSHFYGAKAEVISPYAHRLRYLVPYLQQMMMESNGKRVNSQGNVLSYSTSSILFGDEGCHAQHTYHQLLMQSDHFIPVDFILLAPRSQNPDSHDAILMASGLSQAQALMMGKSYQTALDELMNAGYSQTEANQLAPHHVIPGNRPSNILLLNALSPKQLGALLALYEHKIFVQGVIWDINSFDQWGVELGKSLLPKILKDHINQ